jgi:hypothetical protein
MKQTYLFDDFEDVAGMRRYKSILTASENRKGVLDVDTVKGCSSGLCAYPDGGCYGECYAAKTAKLYGIDFTKSISRKPSRRHFVDTFYTVKNHSASWYRIGTAGDPCHDWGNTLTVCEMLKDTGKTPVIITKHWTTISDSQLERFLSINAVFNTSVSGMDTEDELKHRISQIKRIKQAGGKSICRIVSCQYGESHWARECKQKQDYLFNLHPVIDNPLRCGKNNVHVLDGDIIITKKRQSIGGGKWVSVNSEDVYLGVCANCPDQCGVTAKQNRKVMAA